MARKPPTIRQFFDRFPDDNACLNHLLKVRYGERSKCPKCGREGKLYRIAKRRAYECAFCGHHVYPCVGTPFKGSRTSLQLWFFAMFLFCATRNGVSAKELQRQLGVTYKAAWRMGHEIRKYMAGVDGDGPLGGKPIVEADEAFIGGKDRLGHDDKKIVLGMVERGGDVITRVIPSRHEWHILPHIAENVRPGTRIATDEAAVYRSLPEMGYRHGSVNHSAKQYAVGDVHTNTLEGFWSWVKRMINGTHVWVSAKHLPNYLREMEYRFNLRRSPDVMFDLLLLSFGPPSVPTEPQNGPTLPAQSAGRAA